MRIVAYAVTEALGLIDKLCAKASWLAGFSQMGLQDWASSESVRVGALQEFLGYLESKQVLTASVMHRVTHAFQLIVCKV